MFLEVLMEYSCMMSPELSPPELRFCDIQIVIIIVVVSSVGIKRADCIIINGHAFRRTTLSK